MEESNHSGGIVMNKTVKLPRPIRVLQFGEGNFLRAFADATIDEGNRAGILDCGVAIVKPRNSGNLQVFKNQSCLYTTAIRGLENGRSVETEQIITCIQQAIQPHEEPEAYREIYMGKDLKFVISNTTEAGIIFDPTDSCDGIRKEIWGVFVLRWSIRTDTKSRPWC
jgi:tagaturonate reductase